MTKRRLAAKYVGFVIIPMFGAVTPLLALPAISSMFGQPGWAAIALGQSLGSAVSVFVELGWALTGPQQVARLSVDKRGRLYRLALVTKLTVAVPALILAAALALVIAPSYPLESALAAAGATVAGLTVSWYFLGTGQPHLILLLDSIPRLFAVALSSVALLLGAPLVVSPLALIAVSLAVPFLGLVAVPAGVAGSYRNEVLPTLRKQGHALLARGLSAVYISLPVAIVGVVAPGALPVFAAAERLQRMALAIIQSVPNALQSWVGSSHGSSQLRSRISRSIGINIALGLFAGVAFALMAPKAAQLIFAGTLELPLSLTVLSGLVIFLSCISRATGGLGLVALGNVAGIAVSALVGAVIGVCAIAVFGSIQGAHGAMIGEILAETSVLALQTVFLGSAIRLSRLE